MVINKIYTVFLSLLLSPLLFSAAISPERAKALDDAARSKSQAERAILMVATGYPSEKEIKEKQDLACASFIMQNQRLPDVIAQKIYAMAQDKGRARISGPVAAVNGKLSCRGSFVTTLDSLDPIISSFDLKEGGKAPEIRLSAFPRAWACSDTGEQIAISNAEREELDLYQLQDDGAYSLYASLPVCPDHLALSADQTILAFIEPGDALCVLDRVRGVQLWRAPGIGGNIAISEKGERIATFGNDNKFKVFNTTTGQLIREFPSSGVCSTVALSGDGNVIACHSRADSVETSLWDVATGRFLSRYDSEGGPGHACDQLQLSYDGSLLLIKSHGKALLWHTPTQVLKKTMASSSETDCSHYPLLASRSHDLLIPTPIPGSKHAAYTWSLATRLSGCEFVMARKKEREVVAAHAVCAHMQQALPVGLLVPIRRLISNYMSHAVYGALLRHYPLDSGPVVKV